LDVFFVIFMFPSPDAEEICGDAGLVAVRSPVRWCE
jgi:hypothetical protein